MESIIKINSLCKNFDGLSAVKDVSLTLQRGSITGLIGANGAGKTTLFNLIAGLFAPTSGEIYLENENVSGLAPHQLFAKGMLRTFQLPHEFANLTTLENLMVVPNQLGENIFNAWFNRKAMYTQEKEIYEKALDVLKFLQLENHADELAGNLSGGQKKLLELGRTMMVEAKIVLLDEIGAGVNRSLLNHIGDLILRLQQQHNYTFFMIEHDMDFIARMCQPIIVMAQGEILTQGTIEEIKKDERVIESYLGRSGAR